MPRKVKPEWTIPQARAARVALTMAAESEDLLFAQTAARALAELDRVKRPAEYAEQSLIARRPRHPKRP